MAASSREAAALKSIIVGYVACLESMRVNHPDNWQCRPFLFAPCPRCRPGSSTAQSAERLNDSRGACVAFILRCIRPGRSDGDPVERYGGRPETAPKGRRGVGGIEGKCQWCIVVFSLCEEDPRSWGHRPDLAGGGWAIERVIARGRKASTPGNRDACCYLLGVFIAGGDSGDV